MHEQQKQMSRVWSAQTKQSFRLYSLCFKFGRILCRVSVGFLCSTRLATKSGEYVDLVLQIVLLSSTNMVQQYTQTTHTQSQSQTRQRPL